MERELKNDQKDEIIFHIRKRKGKKKKNKSNKDENTEISSSNNQEKPEEPVKFNIKFEKKERKEFKFDTLDDDYEGGEGDAEDVSDKIQPYDTDNFDNVSNQESKNIGGFNDNIDFMPKKRKKKLIKKSKKPKKLDEMENVNQTSVLDKSNDDSFLTLNKEKSSPKSSISRPSINIHDTNEENYVDGAKILNQKDIDALEEADSEPSISNVETSSKEAPKKRRFYNAKFYLRALWLGHKYVNFYSSYNEHMPRLWRLLILYDQLFIIMLLCGVVFYNPGPTKDTDSLDGYTSFFYAIMIIGIDRVLNMGITYFILRYRQYENRNQSYLQDETVHDYTIHGANFNDEFIHEQNNSNLALENKNRHFENDEKGIVMGKFTVY